MPDRTYPLSNAQALLALSRQYTIHKGITNIPSSVILDRPLDLDRLQTALETAIGRWDAFGMRFTKAPGGGFSPFRDPGVGMTQRFGDDRRALSISRVDFRGKTEDQMVAHFHKVGAKPIKFGDNPQALFEIVTDPSGNTGIFSVISHFILDSWSILSFHHDVLDIYMALEAGTELPKPPPPYEPVLQRELTYTGSADEERDRAFWAEEMATGGEPIHTNITGPGVLAALRRKRKNPDLRAMQMFHLKTSGAHHVRTIDPETVERYTRYCAEASVPSLQVLFNTAMRIYLGKVNDRTPDVTLHGVVASRGTLEEKRCGGSRVQVVLFRTVLPPETPFVAAMGQVYDKQLRLYRHARYKHTKRDAIIKELYGIPAGFGYAALSFTFQPLPLDVGHGMTARTRWYCNGATSQPLYVTVMDLDGTGGLRFYYEYNTSVFTPDDLDAFHDGVLRIIEAALAKPDATVGELMDA